MIHNPITLAERFRRDGFVVVEDLLPRTLATRLGERFAPLFRGEFETGVWPDEWYWREGMSLPDVTRHMGNTWKCDRTIAGVALSAAIGRARASASTRCGGSRPARRRWRCIRMPPTWPRSIRSTR
jgi:hypothetical protein